MKTAKKAWEETREVRDYALDLSIAGLAGIGWGMFELPEHGLATIIGLVLVWFAFAWDSVIFFVALFEVPAWERRMSEKRFAEFKAGNAARVDEAIANYEAARAQRRADRESN